jgi:hypothetical protein
VLLDANAGFLLWRQSCLCWPAQEDAANAFIQEHLVPQLIAANVTTVVDILRKPTHDSHPGEVRSSEGELTVDGRWVPSRARWFVCSVARGIGTVAAEHCETRPAVRARALASCL